MLSYKGYLGTVEFDEENNSFFGTVSGIRQLVTFEADNAADLRASFYAAIDDYLSFCQEENIEPDTPYAGHLSVEISPELHRAVVEYAQKRHMSLNETVSQALMSYV